MTPTYSWESWFKDTWLYSTWGCLYTNLSFSDLKSILEFDFLKICSLYYYLKIHPIHSGPTLPLGTMIWTNFYRVPFTQWCFVEFGWDRLSSGEVDINVKMFTATPTTTDTDKTWPEKLTWSYGSSELNKTRVLASYIKNVLQKWNITLNHFLKIFISSAKNMLFDISNAICVLYSFGSFKTKYYLWNIHLDKWYFTCKSIQVIISLLSATNNDEKLHNG